MRFLYENPLKTYKVIFIFFRTTKKESTKDVIEKLLIGEESVLCKTYRPDMIVKEPPLFECENEVC